MCVRERESVCVCVCEREIECVCERERVCVCVRERKSVCVCVCVLDKEGSWVFASTALAVVWTAVYLTGYSDFLTNFHEPLSPPYRRHTSLKNVQGDITGYYTSSTIAVTGKGLIYQVSGHGMCLYQSRIAAVLIACS